MQCAAVPYCASRYRKEPHGILRYVAVLHFTASGVNEPYDWHRFLLRWPLD